MKLDETSIRKWLEDYAWLGTSDEKQREIDCIMSQSDWKHIDAVAEKFAGQASGEEQDIMSGATGFALSALYECHDAPHLPTCPRWNDRRDKSL